MHYIKAPGDPAGQPCQNCKTIEKDPHPFIAASCLVCGASWGTAAEDIQLPQRKAPMQEPTESFPSDPLEPFGCPSCRCDPCRCDLRGGEEEIRSITPGQERQ